MYEESISKRWDLVALLYVMGGAAAGIIFVAFFVHGPHWLINLSAAAFSFGGGGLGGMLYKRFHCTPISS